jgi:dTMP kinase
MTTGIVIGFAGVGAVISLGFVFVQDALHAGPAGYGVLQATYGIGMAIGLGTIGFLAKVAERDHVVYQAMIAAAVALLLLALMPNLALAAVMIMVLGYFVGTTWVTAYTLLQETVTDEFRGRTFGSLTVMSRLTLFMALVVFPFVSAVIAKALPANPHIVVLGQNFDLSGTRLALALAALMVLVGGLYMRRSLGKFRRTKSEPLGLVPKLKKPPSQGIFVVFEGVEGSGKGTQIERAERWIQTFGRDVLVTREPGGTSMGEQLREILLDHDTGKLEPKTEAMLFGAARAQLVSTVIRPALEQGKVVLCDRYIDSSLAYQGVARGLGELDVLTLNVWATQGLFPDLVVLLHLEPEQGLQRSLAADGEHDRIESEGADFHAKVANAYLHIAEEHPERIVVIDSGRPPGDVAADVQAALRKVIPEAEARDGPAGPGVGDGKDPAAE